MLQEQSAEDVFSLIHRNYIVGRDVGIGVVELPKKASGMLPAVATTTTPRATSIFIGQSVSFAPFFSNMPCLASQRVA